MEKIGIETSRGGASLCPGLCYFAPLGHFLIGLVGNKKSVAR